MGFILKALSYVGIVSGFTFLTLAIAAGLYILSEQVEEHTAYPKRILKRAIYSIITIHLLLFIFDGFPLWITLFSIGVNLTYLQNLKRFPYIRLASKTFIASCIGVVANHYLWFRNFTDPSIPPYAIYKSNPYFTGKTHPPFAQVASFLGLCVWVVPFALFISLSASDNVLPYNNYDDAMMDGTQQQNPGNGLPDDIGAAAKAKRKSARLVKVVIDDVLKKLARALGYEFEPNHGRII